MFNMSPALLIEDPSEHGRDALKTTLSHHCALIITEDLEQACRCAKGRQQLSAILLTVDEESDMALIGEIRKARPTQKITVMASRSNEDAAIEAVRHGASGYVIQPLSPAEILSFRTG